MSVKCFFGHIGHGLVMLFKVYNYYFADIVIAYHTLILLQDTIDSEIFNFSCQL